MSIRAGKIIRFGGNSVELDMDVYNLTNANTIFSVRTGSTTSSVIDYNVAGLPTISVPMFNSPTGALGPRIIRFNVTYLFGTGGGAARK